MVVSDNDMPRDGDAERKPGWYWVRLSYTERSWYPYFWKLSRLTKRGWWVGLDERTLPVEIGPHIPKPRDGDAERLPQCDYSCGKVLHAALALATAALREAQAEIAVQKRTVRQQIKDVNYLAATNAKLRAVVEAVRKLMALPLDELDGESYPSRYIQIESEIREALAALDAPPDDGWRSERCAKQHCLTPVECHLDGCHHLAPPPAARDGEG